MRTIAVTIDEDTLEAIDRLAEAAGGSRPGGGRVSRSQIVRTALRDFVETQERTSREEKERRIIDKHRDLLARQAASLVREQAKP